MNAIERATSEISRLFVADGWHRERLRIILRKHLAEPAERADQWPKESIDGEPLGYYRAEHRQHGWTIVVEWDGAWLNDSNDAQWDPVDFKNFNPLPPQEQANRPAERADQWRTIESAPKDGTRILVVTDTLVEVAHWGPISMVWIAENGGVSLNATHWRPLPLPPQEQANG